MFTTTGKRARITLSSGAPFKNTNLPPGYDYEPWTMEGLMMSQENGQLPVDAGDWD